MKLSRPNPTREMLPAAGPAMTATRPSSKFQAITLRIPSPEKPAHFLVGVILTVSGMVTTPAGVFRRGIAKGTGKHAYSRNSLRSPQV